jgi:hypothetical protein
MRCQMGPEQMASLFGQPIIPQHKRSGDSTARGQPCRARSIHQPLHISSNNAHTIQYTECIFMGSESSVFIQLPTSIIAVALAEHDDVEELSSECYGSNSESERESEREVRGARGESESSVSECGESEMDR